MAAVRAEIWGLCPNCRGWFYCAGWFDKTAAAPTCPVCAWDRVAIENRAFGIAGQEAISPVGWERDIDRPNPAGWLSLEEQREKRRPMTRFESTRAPWPRSAKLTG